MNSLKGLGVCALLAALVVGMHELADSTIIVVVTVSVVLASIATYLASRRRYHRDRRTALG
jgi:predicted cation transporter